jgi:hypothetical protein
MKKTLISILSVALLFGFYLNVKAESCIGNATWEEKIVNGRLDGKCVCNIKDGKEYPSCTPASSAGTPNLSAKMHGCDASGGSWGYEACNCPSGKTLQQDSSYWGWSCLSSGGGTGGGSTGGGGTGGGSTGGGNTGGGSYEQPTGPGVGGIQIENPIKAKNFEELIDSLVNFLFYVAIVLAPLMIVWGGILFLTSGGDSKKYETGKSVIMYAAIGLFIVMFAKGVISIVRNIIK